MFPLTLVEFGIFLLDAFAILALGFHLGRSYAMKKLDDLFDSVRERGDHVDNQLDRVEKLMEQAKELNEELKCQLGVN